MNDLEAMADVWETTDRVVCAHPGWGLLRGWEPVRDSFSAIFGGSSLQFIVTDVRVEVEGDTGWVTCDENIWGAGVTGTVSALNLFVRDPLDRRWRLVAHHGSPVPDTGDDEETDA